MPEGMSEHNASLTRAKTSPGESEDWARARSMLRAAAITRACYELAQGWLANAENGLVMVNRANRGIRVLMRFFSQVHNTL